MERDLWPLADNQLIGCIVPAPRSSAGSTIIPFYCLRNPPTVDKVAHLFWSRRPSSSDSDPLANTPSPSPSFASSSTPHPPGPRPRPREIMSEPTAQQNLTPQFCFSTTALRGTHNTHTASYPIKTPPPYVLYYYVRHILCSPLNKNRIKSRDDSRCTKTCTTFSPYTQKRLTTGSPVFTYTL